jgi:hypothetical protein
LRTSGFHLYLRAADKAIEDIFPASDPEAIVVPEAKRARADAGL